VVCLDPGAQLRRLSGAGVARGGLAAGEPRRCRDHRRGRRLERQPGAGGRSAGPGSGPVLAESRASGRYRYVQPVPRARDGTVGAPPARRRRSPPWFFTGPWNKRSPSPPWSPLCCRVRDLDATTRRSTRPGPTGRGPAYGRTRSTAFAVSNRVRAPGIVVRRAAYERVGGYRTDLPHAADWDMWTRLAAQGPIVFVDEVLAVYRGTIPRTAGRGSGRGRTSGSESPRSAW
jgi:hypothetical protein